MKREFASKFLECEALTIPLTEEEVKEMLEDKLGVEIEIEYFDGRTMYAVAEEVDAE